MVNGDITITILGKSSTGDSSDGTKKKKEKSAADLMRETVRKILNPTKTAQEGIINLFGGEDATNNAINFGKSIVKNALTTAYDIAMTEHNRYFTLTEDYIAQNRMNSLTAQLGTATSMIGSAIAGAMAGLDAGGIPGAIIGATVGVAITGTKLRVEHDKKIEQHNMQLNAVNAQTEFMASRASLVNGGRGTEY